MNKIYKVVWNTVRNCYVVGSELISSKSGRHSTSNGKSSSLKVTLTVLALCGMTALGSGVAPAYAADAGAAVESQYVAVLVNSSNNSRRDYRDFDGYSYHKERIASTGDVYWVRDGYTIKYEADKRYPGARNANIIKAYKTSSYTADSDAGLLKSNQIMVESAGISTLTGVDLDNVSGGTYVGATNSGSTSTPSSFNYMIKDDNGTYVDAGNTKFSKRFKAATKNKDGTYSYNGEVIANDNLYVVNEQVGVFVTSSGKVYTGKVFGANNEVLMTTKSNEGTMYSYWGADTPDPNTKLADMTIGQFNQALEKVNNNSKAVAGDTIKEIKTTAKTDGGTIDLVRRGQYNSATGQYEGEHKVGNGITITSRGGTNGEDVKINFSNDNGKTGFDVAAGSKVEAVGTKEATTGLKINGETYNISGTDYRVVANPAEGSKGIYKPDASGKIELTVQDAKTGATSKVQLSDVASATTVNNNYTTLDTKIDKTKTDITNAYTTTINETKNTITNEYKKYVADTEDYVTSGSISGDTITLKRALGGEVAITGLKDYVEGLDSYVTSASLKDNKLTITQNNGKGNYEIDLSGFADQFSGTDYRVVANPAEGSKGIYKPDASGNIELTVQDTKTGATSTVQLSDIASATTVTNNYNTLNTKIDDTKTDITNAYTTKINDTKTTITNEYQKYVRDNEDYVTSGSISNDTITLKRALGGEVAITGLKDYVEGLDSYVTSASLKDNKLTITQNNGKGNYEIDLSDFANQFSGTDYRVVANPAKDSGGIYKPDASGNIELTVQDAKTGATSTIKLSDIASATAVTNNYTTLDMKINDTKTDITNEYNTAIDNAKTEIQNDYNTKIDAAKTHYYSVNSSATGEGSNYNNDGAVGLGSIAVGANAYANGRIGASAFGNRAYADGERALAVGYGSKAQGLAAIAIGTGSRHGADGTDAIAIGEQSYAKGGYTTAVGGYSQAVADGATAFGQQAVASGSHSTAIGIQSQALGIQSTAVGDYSKTEGTATVAFGGYSKTTGNIATALGYASKSVTRGTAVGAASSVTGETGTALGLLSTASANGSVALGAQSSADIDAGVTGYNPNTVEGEDLTSPTWTSTLGAVSVGAAATVDKDGNPVAQKTRQITNLAAGTADTDAVNVAQLKKSRVELTDGTNTTVNSTNDENDGHVIYSVDVKTNGTINKGDTNIVTGDTVYNALQNVSWTAKVNGTDAKTVKKDGTLNFVNGDNIAISNDNGDIKISTTGLASSGDLWTAQAGGKDVKAVDQKVNFNSTDKHLVVESTQDGEITFATKDLADTSFTNITEEGNTYIKNLAKGEDRHIEAKEYAVSDDGSVTMTYVDGNGKPVTGEAKITGIAKSDLSNITNEGNTVINNIAKEAVKVVKGTNTTVTEGLSEDGKTKTYAVNVDNAAIQAATDVTGENGISVTSAVENGVKKYTVSAKLSNNFAIDQATGNIDLAPSITVGKTNPVTINGNKGEITGLTNKTLDVDGFATQGRAATEEQLKAVDSKATAAKTTVTAGKNIEVKGQSDENGSAYTVALADDVSLGNGAIQLKGSDGSISATSGTSSLNFNDKGLSLSNGKNSTVINGGTITVNDGESVISGTQATFGKIKLNAESGSTITGLTNTTTDYTGFATAGRAATEEQLKEVAGQASEAITTAGKGWNLTTNKGTATNIAPDGTVDFSSGNDNLVISNAGADLSFSLSDNLDLTNNKDKKGSVKVGENTTLTDELLQVGKDVSLTASALNVGNSSLTTDALMVGGFTYISSSGINANGRVISNVRAGVLDTDAVNVGQLKSAISGSQVSIKAGDGISVAKTGNQYTINVNIEGVTNNQGKVTVSTGDSTSTESGSESGSSGAKKFRVMDLMYRAEVNEIAPETTTDTGKAIQIENIPENIKLEADDNQAASVVNGETIKIAGDGKNISTKANVTGAGSMDTISVSLKPDIQVDSVTINNGGPTINNTGIDMNSHKITNLDDGEIAEGSKDAVNGGQLYNTNQAVIANAENINSLSHSLNKLDSRINRVGAGAAALAALHPLDFDPDNKWDFAAGYGNYAGANAVAIGTYYRPNENTMFSIGGSFGGGENMINAGVSFKLGSGGSGITTSKTVMAKKIKEQDELLKAQDAKMKEQDEKIAKLEALVAQQGEMIQQALGKK